MESSFTAQLQYAIETLMSPAGALAAIAWVLFLVVTIFSPKAKWLALVGMIWCSALSFYVEDHAAVRLATPLDQIRSHGRLLCTAFLAALFLPAVLAPRGWRLRLISAPIIFLFLFEMMYGVRILAAGVQDRGLTTLCIYPMIFVVLGWGASKWIHNWADAHKILRRIALAACVYVLGCCYQLLINQSAIVHGSRLMGTSGNPQLAAILIAMALPVACYLVARSSEPIVWRTILAAFVGLMIIMLLWTGSRTGVLIAAIGILLTFWERLGRFLIVGLVIGVFVLLAMQIYDESTASVTAMFARGDTRTAVWSGLITEFVQNPAFGAMRGEFGVGENSYLSVAAYLGLYGLIPLLAFVSTSIWMLVKLFLSRKLLGSEKPFADLIIGGLVAMFVGAGFEGYLLGTLTFPVFFIYLYLGLGNFALDALAAAQQQPSLTDDTVPAIDPDNIHAQIPAYGQYAEHYL